MKYGKRLLVLLITMAMLVTSVPFFVFAGSEDASDTLQDVPLTEAMAESEEPEDIQDDFYAEDESGDEDFVYDEFAEDAEDYDDEILSDEELVLEGEDPDLVYGEDPDAGDADEGYAELGGSWGVDPDEVDAADSDTLLEEFMYQEASGDKTAGAESVKGSRLTGRDLIYYNGFKKIITNVSAAKQSSTELKVSVSKVAGARKFTAKQLGVSKIGYKKNGKWHVTKAAMKKIQKILNCESWKRVYKSLECDLAAKGYWVGWYMDQKFYEWDCPFNFTAKTMTFKSGSSITFKLPVNPEFAKAASSSSKYIYKADLSKIKGAKTAIDNAKYFVNYFDSYAAENYQDVDPQMIDYIRLRFYANVVCMMTEYDHYSAGLPEKERYWRGPWDMIYVFDNDSSTNVVCAGYARAYKYLCDLSKFKSKWIDCQIVTGSAGEGENSSHMWNLVRMNDGYNYVVDPTWMDDGDQADLTKWFLRGAPNGTANSYTIEGNTRVYDSWLKAAFPAAERTLSKLDRYVVTTDRAIKLKGTKVKKLVKAKKAITVKWTSVKAPIAALYVDGYQIQYSLKKNFKSAKKVTVYGYARASRKITKLKSKKTYYVRIRTFAKLGGKTYYSKWSAAKKIKTK